MSSKNLTITLSKVEHDKLEKLVEFFQKQSISNVTKSDVMKFLINKSHDLAYSDNNEKILEFYRHLGIEATIESTEKFLNLLKEEKEPYNNSKDNINNSNSIDNKTNNIDTTYDR